MRIEDLNVLESKDVTNGLDSVSKGIIFIKNGLPHCKRHGAINCVAILSDNRGRIWRCLTCNEGCFEHFLPVITERFGNEFICNCNKVLHGINELNQHFHTWKS